MNQNIILYPLLWQMVVAIVLIFCWRKPQWHRNISIVGGVGALAISITFFMHVWAHGITKMNSGNWPAPFGITLVADTFSAVLVVLVSLAGLCVSIFSIKSILGNRISFGYFSILHFLLMGLSGSFLTGDIFNLYVWFEIIIISSFVLLSLGGQKAQLEASVKYFTLNILASTIFLTGIAIVYGLTGSLNLADISLKMAAVEDKTIVRIAAIIFLVGFGIKSAVFPLYFWLPASYHTPPSPVSAIFGGLLTKVGVYAMIRLFTLVFPTDPYFNNMVISVAIFTIITGGLGAIIEKHVQRIFGYLIVCHIGFMLTGIGLGSKVALTGVVFYMMHDIVVKTNLFMTGGLIYQIEGNWDTRKIGGLYTAYPWLSLLLVIPLFSVVGIPPLSGFWPKVSLITAGFSASHYWAVGGILLGTFLTLFVIAKFWADVFWKRGGDAKQRDGFLYFGKMSVGDRRSMIFPIALLGFVSLYIGFGAGHIQLIAERIANELTNTQPYIDAVLGTITQKGGTP
jgi:multicomponent Na+:H+ antiporter subunit D